MKSASIGIFDSGFGGLTVMNAVKNLMPHENICYFGDTGNLPYGDKSAEIITAYCVQNTNFLATLNIKLLIIACHTACTTAYETLQKTLSLPIVGVTEPSINLLKQQAHSGTILLLGTRRTVASGVYQQKIKSQIPCSNLITLACPLFVPIVEEGFANHPIAKTICQEYLSPLKEQTINAALLGCTHYPLLRKHIQKELGPAVALIDPSEECAKEAQQILKKNNLLNQGIGPAHYQFYVSDNPEQFRQVGKQFLQYPINNIVCTKQKP